MLDHRKSKGIPKKVYFGFPCGSAGKKPPGNAGDLDWEDPLEKKIATHSNILVWEIPWTEESSGL